MTVHLVNFATENMTHSGQLCGDSALRHGVDRVWPWREKHFPQMDFFRENHALLTQPRGCGFWAWKPCILLDTMINHCLPGDVLIYCDAGVEWVGQAQEIIRRMEDDIFIFGNMFEHAHWCKRDVIDVVIPGAPWERFGKQAQASVVFFRTSTASLSFLFQWRQLCLVPHLIDDSPSEAPNHPEFREHRHDQAILTTLAMRDGHRLHWWPAMYNGGAFTYEKTGFYTDDDYPVLFHHHRKRNDEWNT